MATMSEPEPDRTHPSFALRRQAQGVRPMPIPASTVSDRSDEQAGGTPEVPPGTSEGSDLPKHFVSRNVLIEHIMQDMVDPYIVTDPDTGGRKGKKLARLSSIPADVLLELAEHYGKGEDGKYPNDPVTGQPNWQRGYSWRLSVDALGRHLLAFLAGEDIDPDSGSSHLIAVMWHCATLRWFQLNGKGTDYRD